MPWDIPHLVSRRRRHRQGDSVPELSAAKAYAALIGAVVTGVLGTVPPHTPVWTVLTFVAAACTAVATFRIPNKPKG